MRTTNRTRKVRSTIIIGLFLLHAIAAAGWASDTGELVSWGWDGYGLVSDTSPGNDFSAASAGGVHSVALKSNGPLVAYGSLEAWGLDSYGQVSDTPSGDDFKTVSAGGSHNVALKSDGSMVAWGFDLYGQVSDTPSGNDFVDVKAGYNHNLALKSDGSLVAWGNDADWQVSDTPAGSDFVTIAAGYNHNVALKSDGSLVAWGKDSFGQVSNTPVGSDFTAISGGSAHNIALKSDGSLVSWGCDTVGQVSDTPAGNDFVAVAAGEAHSVALKSDGSLVAWGWDKYGQVSDTPEGNDFIAVFAGRYHNVAIRDTVSPPPTTYTLTINVSPGGSGAVTKYPNESSYSDGEYVQLTATAYSGYIFGHWSGDVSSYSNPVTITMNSNKTVTANFLAALPAVPSVSITATDAFAGEPANDGYFTVSRTGDTSEDLLVYYSTSGGTATAGTDYRALASPVKILSGQSSASIAVDVIDDSMAESSETVRLTISSNAAYDIGSPSYATVTIADDDDQPPAGETIVTITAPDASAGEPDNDGYFTISRTGDTASSLRVYYVTSGSTAFPGIDYEPIPSYVDIPSGKSSAVISVVVIDDTAVENLETVQLTIWSTSAYTIGSPGSATVTVTDNDGIPVEKPVVTIAATDASAGEPSNNGYFTVSRTGATSSSLLVYYATSGTATAGTDYVALPGYVNIPSGQSSASIPVTVYNDSTVESSETVRVTISSSTAYTIGSPSYATVTIADDDYQQPEQPVVTITAPDASAGEPFNDGAFTVSRTGDTSSDLLVYYITSGTATAGTDYVALPGYVNIPSGQSSASIPVTVYNDSTVESSETVRVTISSSTAYTIGSPSYATVTITDDDDVPPPPSDDAEQLMADTLTFFYASVDDGSLVGTGNGKSNLVSFRKMVETAYDQIVAGNYAGACGQLAEAYDRCDGLSVPSDYVTGSATSTLEAMIQEVIDALGC